MRSLRSLYFIRLQLNRGRQADVTAWLILVTGDSLTIDFREQMFADAEWYRGLAKPLPGETSAWYTVKAPDRWEAELLSTAGKFAVDHQLLDHYRRRFQGIVLADLAPARAKAQRRSVCSPIWVIAHELVVGAYLEHVLGWALEAHEPLGNKLSKGDWQFRTPEGQSVFVEVKTALEPMPMPTTGVFSKGVKDKQIREILRGAYKQLPTDDRSTLVVIVGYDMLEISHGILFGDLFQTLFGAFQLKFRPFAEDLGFTAGPSLREMHVHGTKHRQLGCVAGMYLSGIDFPKLEFYAIDNPFAHGSKRLPARTFERCRRFLVDSGGHGEELTGLEMVEGWRTMRGALFNERSA